jgi:hypothetical protein
MLLNYTGICWMKNMFIILRKKLKDFFSFKIKTGTEQCGANIFGPVRNMFLVPSSLKNFFGPDRNFFFIFRTGLDWTEFFFYLGLNRAGANFFFNLEPDRAGAKFYLYLRLERAGVKFFFIWDRTALARIFFY